MTLTALRTFLTILETGSLVAAARRLNVTQSTVTARLKALEAELGQTLITRDKSGIALTGPGVRLKRYAETITELWRQARQETALPSAMRAVCNIGCHADLWPGLGQRLFDRVRTHEPDVALSAWWGTEDELARWLGAGLCDVVLTYRPAIEPRQVLVELPPDRLTLVSTRPDAPMRFDPGYVFVEAGEEFGRRHAEAYADANAARISFGGAALALEFLLREGGSAYLPERIAAPRMAEGRLHPVPGAPVFDRPAFLVATRRVLEDLGWLRDAVAAVAAGPGREISA